MNNRVVQILKIYQQNKEIGRNSEGEAYKSNTEEKHEQRAES